MSIRNGDKAMYGKQRKSKLRRRERIRELTAKAASPAQTQAAQKQVSFACRDAGHADCEWRASAANSADLLNKVREHARQNHDLTTVSAERRKEIQKHFKTAS